jgi:integrase/recombinase XerD
MTMPSRINDECDRFHTTDAKLAIYTKNSIRNAIAENRITQDDGNLIHEFITETAASGNLKPCRKFKLTSILVQLRGFLPPFRSCTMADVYHAIEKIREAKTPTGKVRFSPDTIADYMRTLKRFSRWLAENGYASGIKLDKLNKIKMPRYGMRTKTAEQMLTPDEVKRIIEACTTSRDRALVAMLYEGGFRVGELGTLRWNQVKFNDWNVVLNVEEKTGFPRYVPLVMSKPYLAQWKNDYPVEIHEDGHVFLTQNTKIQLEYPSVNKQLCVLTERAGIQKPVTPHLFRHSRITHLIQQGYNESIIKKMMWGNLTTQMFRVYAHLTDDDIENEIAKMNGIVINTGKKETRVLDPRQCSRCCTINPPTNNFCATCGLPLTEDYQHEWQATIERLDKIADTPEGKQAAVTELQSN